MYYVMVAGLMVVLPVASIVIEWLSGPGAELIPLIGKWFVFWAVGVRLCAAGIKQIVQPEFTARRIFGIEEPGAMKVVSELGISNVAIGAIGIASLYFPSWTLPAAIYGLIFFGLAGVRHLGNRKRNAIENMATATDLWAALVLAVYVIGAIG